MNEQLGNLHGTELDSLNMGDSYVTLFVGGSPGSGSRTYSRCVNWLFEAYDLW